MIRMPTNLKNGRTTTRPTLRRTRATKRGARSNAQRGRVRLHRVSQAANGLEVDDDRRKSLGEKGWARRAVVVRGVEPSGAADFEAVPGREEYDLGEDGSAAWAQDMLEFADDNFNDAGIEVRSMDQRDRQVGLFVNAWAMASLSSGGPTRRAGGCTSSRW